MLSATGLPLVTVVMVQRDRVSVAGRAIRQLFDVTEAPFVFVYVDGRSHRSVRRELDRLRDELGFVVLRRPPPYPEPGTDDRSARGYDAVRGVCR